MDKGKLKFAGRCALILAACAVPLMVLELLAGKQGWGFLRLLTIPADFAALWMGVYILATFRNLLNVRKRFHEVDNLISITIVIMIVATILSSLSQVISPLKYFLTAANVLLLIVQGVVHIVFANRIIKLSDDLYGLLRPIYYSTLAIGVCAVTVVLAPVGLLIGIFRVVLQAMIFFRAAECEE